METKTHPADDGAREAILAKAAGLWPVAKGSLTQTRSPCTRKNCKECASGRKHPRLLSTFREEGLLRDAAVMHADETLWRTDGDNGYAWPFVAGRVRLFACEDTHRTTAVPSDPQTRDRRSASRSFRLSSRTPATTPGVHPCLIDRYLQVGIRITIMIRITVKSAARQSREKTLR